MNTGYKKLLFAVALLFATPLTLAACQVPGTDVTLTSPTVEGASLQQNAYAVVAAYAEAAEEAAELVENPDTPEVVKTTLATLVLNTEPAALLVKDAFAAYDKKVGEVKARKDAGETDISIALNEASDLYATAVALWREHGDILGAFPGMVSAVKK